MIKMDKYDIPINVFLHLSKAFDTIDHNILQNQLAKWLSLAVVEGKIRQRFGDMGLIELRKTNHFQPQSHF